MNLVEAMQVVSSDPRAALGAKADKRALGDNKLTVELIDVIGVRGDRFDSSALVSSCVDELLI